MGEFLLTDELPMESLLKGVAEQGAVSLPILKPDIISPLVVAAYQYPLKIVTREVEGGIIQEASSCFVQDGPLLDVVNEIHSAATAGLNHLDDYPFKSKLEHNQLILWAYPAGSIGVTPHADGFEYINLVMFLRLSGTKGGEFGVCDDADKNNARIIPASPGDLILMRAPGFKSRKGRQTHFVNPVGDEPRMVLGMLQSWC
jgi:hypothetical protein